MDLNAIWNSFNTILQALCVFFIATVIFDGIHYLLHQCALSRHPILNKLGNLHLSHHRFFPRNLKINYKYQRQNFYTHVMIENIIQLIIILLCLFLFKASAVILAIFFQISLFLIVFYYRGEDKHHRSYEKLSRHHAGLIVTAQYHALHHLYSRNYYSSYIKVVDFLFGTGHHLAGKRIVMTGANGALGRHMKKFLEREKCIVTSFQYGSDYTYDNYQAFIPALKEADILLLCHGSKYLHAQEANCDSYVKLIELYKEVHQEKILPPEVWATGSEIECHPCFGIEKIKVYAASKRNYARFAHLYYRDKSIQYRHLVHSAFMSNMGPGLMSAKCAAYVSLFLIKRGFRYVPVSYTGFAFLNYLRFAFNI